MPTEFTPRDVIRLFIRHKYKFFFTFLSIVGLSIAVTALMKPRYRSEAMLFVRLGRENAMLDPTASFGSGSVVSVPQGREDEINSVVELLSSRLLAEKIVDAFGPEALTGKSDAGMGSGDQWAIREIQESWAKIVPSQPPDPREDAVEVVQKRLSIYAPKKSTVIHVTYDGPTPKLAQAVAQAVIDQYLEDHVRLNRTAGSHDFFAEQTSHSRQRLGQSESQLRDLKNSTGLASVADQRRILVERIGRLEDDLLKTGAELSSNDAELAALQDKLDRLPETRVTQRVSGLPNSAADGMRQQLYALQLKEQEMKSTFTEDARQVKEIRRQIQEARAILAKEEEDRTQSTNASDPTHAQLHLALHSKQTLVSALRAKTQAVQRQLAETRSSLAELNDHEIRLAQLQRDVDLQDTAYRSYAQNLEQARVDQALKLERISNISVAQPASYSTRMVRPQPLLNVGLGLLAGLAAGVCLVLAAEYFDRLVQERDARQPLAPDGLLSLPSLDAQQVTFSGTQEIQEDYAVPR